MESLAVGNERAHRKDRLAKTVLHKQPVHVWLLPRYYTIQSTRSHTPTWIRIASTTTSRTERHSCKFAWLPPYNDMQNVPKRRQSSCSHYRSVCHCTRRSHPLTRARNTSTVPHSELIHTRQARQRRATKKHHLNICNPIPGKHLQLFTRVT